MQPSHGGGVTIAPVTVAPTVISTARTEPSAGSAASSAERTSTSGDNSAPQISVVTLPSGVALPAGTVTVTVAPGTLPSYQQAAQLLASQTTANMTGAIVAQPLPLLDGQSVVSLAPIQKVEDNSECVFEADKRAIYRHPLFPLLNLLFEKCEQASHTTDCPSADSFNVDIQQFVHQQEREQKPFFSDDPNLDSLMVKAIQVLRIHLLELEKVTDLCKDFCTRYITCLKGKLQSENLLRIEGSEFDLSPPTTPTPLTPTSTPQVVSAVGGGGVLIQSGGIQQAALPLPTLSQGQLVSGGTVYQMVQTPQGIVAQPVQIQTSAIQTAIPQGSLIHGSTPLSQIGMVAPVTQATTPTGTVASPFVLSATPTSPSDDDDRYGDKKSKRGVLPKSATQVMKSWLFQHIIHPYPTEDEKRQIAAQTNLTLLQVNNWFINARRRILQPMLDSSNPDPSKTKKSRPPSRPVQRFWPDKIANLQPQLSTSGELSDTEADCVQQEVPNEAAVGQSELSNSPDTDMAQQILIQPGPLFSTDGQVVQTGTATVSLAGFQGAQLTTVLGQGGRLLLQNGTVAAQVPEITLKKDS